MVVNILLILFRFGFFCNALRGKLENNKPAEEVPQIAKKGLGDSRVASDLTNELTPEEDIILGLFSRVLGFIIVLIIYLLVGEWEYLLIAFLFFLYL